jgi:hypothetical protein
LLKGLHEGFQIEVLGSLTLTLTSEGSPTARGQSRSRFGNVLTALAFAFALAGAGGHGLTLLTLVLAQELLDHVENFLSVDIPGSHHGGQGILLSH